MTMELTPGRLDYVRLYGMPGLDDGVDWPVSGWASYLVWRWTPRWVELWSTSYLARIRVPLNHGVLKCPMRFEKPAIPSRIAASIRRIMAMHDRNGLSYPVSCNGIASYLDTLDNFDVKVEPALDVEDNQSGSITEEGQMAKAKTEDTSGKKRGSGAWIREQLLNMHKGTGKKRDDEQLAAEARDRFGGNSGPSDIAWNRNKLRKDGQLPKPERKSKAKTEKPAAKSGGKRKDAAGAATGAAA